MKKMTRILTVALLGLSLAGIVASCKKGPVEKVGEKIDNAVQDSKDTAQDIKDDVTKKH